MEAPGFVSRRLVVSLPRPCRAVVVGASGGIGSALVARLATVDLIVHRFVRSEAGSGYLDLTDEASIAAAAAEVPADPPVRLVIVATGVLHDDDLQPEKSLKTVEASSLARSFAINAIGPVLVAKHMIPLLPREGKAVLAILSARVGSIEDNRLGGWYGYRASKAALNQLVRTIAIEVRRTHPQAIVVALHPGTVATSLSAPFSDTSNAKTVFTPSVAASHLLDVIDALAPTDTGGFFAWDGQAIPF